MQGLHGFTLVYIYIYICAVAVSSSTMCCGSVRLEQYGLSTRIVQDAGAICGKRKAAYPTQGEHRTKPKPKKSHSSEGQEDNPIAAYDRIRSARLGSALTGNETIF